MIGTYQSAKGLEFDLVIMPFCGSQFLPDQRRVMEVGIDEAQAEDMRLLYVGVTRARQYLALTFTGQLTTLFPNQWSIVNFREM